MTDEREFLAWCETLFDEPAEDLSMETRREEIPGWDSMGSLLLMADLDEVHGIQLSEEDLAGLETLGDIAALIESRRQPAG